MKELTPLEAGAARIALAKMVSGTFYITDFDALCKVLGVSCDARTHNALALLHCVAWNSMDAPTRREVTRAILGTFGVPEPIEEPPKPSLWARLAGGAP